MGNKQYGSEYFKLGPDSTYHHAVLGPKHDFVDCRCWDREDLSHAFCKTEACGNILSKVAALQARHVVSRFALARMREPIVGFVCVHAALQRGGVTHLAVIAINVPLLQGASILPC